MKTSNLLLLSALIIFLVSLGIYNSALKAEYLTGNYKKPFKNYTVQNFKDFDEIEINAANQMDVNITSGTNAVRVAKNATDQIKITQKGKKLIINMVYPQDNRKSWFNSVMISCPKLVSVKTHAFYTNNGKRIIENENNEDNNNYNYHEVTITGFKQDSLHIEQDNASKVILKNNNINWLSVLTGTTVNATPKLKIDKGNSIQKADMQIGEKTELDINNVYIPQLKYHFSDSAKVVLSGIALKSLKQ
jgi:hypothetical protein